MRTVLNWNEGWTFYKGVSDINVKRGGVSVTLPHTWNNKDGQDGGNDYFRGTCIYRKTLFRTDLPEGKVCYLEIKGANSSARVYLNGKEIGSHDGGYSTWRVKLTGLLDQDNEIVIAVDNSERDEVYPTMADFTFYGGLYRDVNLILVEPTHFDLDYYGGRGVIVTPTVDGKRAVVHIKSFVTEKQPEDELVFTVYDMSGKLVRQVKTKDESTYLEFDNPVLWHGRKNPYLYELDSEIVRGGRVIDSLSVRFGCRSFRIDPDKGFILNGEEYPLRGVSRHQDRWGFGNALLPEHHGEDIDLICEVGATTVRLAHYQHDEYFYDLCDERGLVVWAEIPYISKHNPEGRENTLNQMRELIIQNYNHPSIVVWGLSNEITIGGESEDLIDNHRELNRLAHELDKTRPTVIACVSMLDTDSPLLKIPDAVSYNHYFGWYGGETDMNGPWFDRFHEKHPTIPIGCSEYGCEALNWHTSRPVQGDYTEEYQAYYHEELIKQLFSRKYLWATHVWNMFDFGADARAEGGENGQNHKGLVTIDRRYKKDAFYAYKAWLSDEPFVHLCGKRYVDRVENPTRVTVYSNLPEVELFVNGKSVGKKRAPDHFFRFDVKNEGDSRIVAVAGQCRDEGELRRVSEPNQNYILREKGAVLNWFDVDAPEGRFSLNDKISDIIHSPEGRRWFEKIVLKLSEGAEKKKGAFQLSPEMLEMMGGFTLLRMTSMASMMNVEFTKEELLRMNRELNEIKKT